MDVQTKTLGTVSINDSQKIKFPAGLFGFENYTEFALLEAEYKPFFWLQSTQDKMLAFLVVDPFLFCPEYEPEIDDHCLEIINVKSPSDVYLLAIVTVPSDGTPVTANLQGPVVINKENKMAIQAVLSDPRWTTKHNIIEEMKKRGKTC